jgi:hypothetical protein
MAVAKKKKKMVEKKTGETYASKKGMMKHEKGESKMMKMMEGETMKKGGKKMMKGGKKMATMKKGGKMKAC